MTKQNKKLTAIEEANMLLKYLPDWPQVMQLLTSHFQTLQLRTQIILTLATLTLTITGFSGPKIAASNIYSKLNMIGGLVFVLSSIVVALIGTLKINWLTQIKADGQKELLIAMIVERNKRTGLFRVMLCLLVVGLSMYVGSVILFLMIGMNGQA